MQINSKFDRLFNACKKRIAVRVIYAIAIETARFLFRFYFSKWLEQLPAPFLFLLKFP